MSLRLSFGVTDSKRLTQISASSSLCHLHVEFIHRKWLYSNVHQMEKLPIR